MSKTLLAAVLFAAALPTVASASIRWKGDFSTGDLSQWQTQMVSPDRLQVVPADANPSGSQYMMRTLVKQGDNPIHASGNRNEVVNPTYTHEGQESYYRWQTKFDANFPSAKTWQLFTQWHQQADCCGSPPIQFYVNGEEILLTLGKTENVVWRTPLKRGQWHDFVMHVKFSDDPNTGYLELWYDGQKVMEKTYGLTMAVDYLKMGLYRANTIQQDGIIFHTGMVEGDSFEDVVPPTPTASSSDSNTPPTATGTNTSAPSNSAPLTTGQTAENAPGPGGCSAAGSPASLGSLAAMVGFALIRTRKRLSRRKA